ncbi:MAG TPA: glycosyl hydrolase [Phnomibacter sp.]|nr:glycosyl hydrolase [Phnomibacter sp.]
MKPNRITACTKLVVTIVFFAIQTSLFAQLQWPAVTPTSKPWTRWWWQGSSVNEKDLTAAMLQYQQAGLGGLELTPIYGVQGQEKNFIDFLSPRWMQMLDYTLKEGKRLGLGIDMATGTGWPFGGPWITDKESSKYVAYKNYTLNGGEKLNQKIEYIQEPFVRTANGKSLSVDALKDPVNANANLQALAIDQVRFKKPLPLQLLMAYDENGKGTDITSLVDANGNLNWTAPAGKYNLYALFLGWHGKMVERAAPGGEGNVIDHFDENAIQHYLAYFDKAFAGHDVSGINSFFNDSYEVDDARGQGDWTPAFFAEFKKRRGYDLKQFLPQFFSTNNDATHLRLLYDYRLTISELLLEHFTVKWKEWAAKKGATIRNQSHGSPANILDLYGTIDIPETEGLELLRIKFAPSASNILGKKYASAEAATWLKDHFQASLSDVKKSLDRYFLGGVNHVFYHGTNYSPQNAVWPGWQFYAAVEFNPSNPFWGHFKTLNQYVTRAQSFLQQGVIDNDVLVYFPIHDKDMEPISRRGMLHHYDGVEGFDGTDFKHLSEEMLKEGYAFDFISDKQVQQLKATPGAIQTGGTNYQTILLSNNQYIPLETMKKLMQLSADGATILVYKQLPSSVPGLAKLDENNAALKALQAQLVFQSQANGTSVANIGKGKWVLTNDMEALLQGGAVRKETMYSKGLQCIRRKQGNSTTYFIANWSGNAIDEWITLSTKATAAAIYNLYFGTTGVAETRTNSKGELEIRLQLKPDESCVVKTATQKITGNAYAYTPATKATPQTLEGPWQLKFVSGGPTLPASKTLNSLQSWTELPGNEYQIFSGTAQYTIQFKKPTNAGAYWLDLGKVQESAEVILNGKKLAVLIGPAYGVRINAADLKPTNILQINVANSMANRIIDLDKRGVKWKTFYNINFAAHDAENRGSDGLFTTEKWQPRASGLLGPVTITTLNK